MVNFFRCSLFSPLITIIRSSSHTVAGNQCSVHFLLEFCRYVIDCKIIFLNLKYLFKFLPVIAKLHCLLGSSEKFR